MSLLKDLQQENCVEENCTYIDNDLAARPEKLSLVLCRGMFPRPDECQVQDTPNLCFLLLFIFSKWSHKRITDQDPYLANQGPGPFLQSYLSNQ